jgi:peptide/nickel transport system permease protein
VSQVAAEPITGPAPLGPEAAGEPSQQVVGRSPWQLFWIQFRRDRFALGSIVFIALMAVAAIGAPVIAGILGHGPNDVDFLRQMTNQLGLPKGPNFQLHFFFGADTAGRDLFVRVLYGARTSLIIAIGATAISLVLGVLIGMAAGYYRGKVDTFLSRLTDVVMSLPILLLAIGLASACGASREGCLDGLLRPGLFLVSMIIGFFNWPYIARIVRGQVLTLREKEFVEAARAQGAGDWRIMRRHILPNVAAPIIVYTTLIIPNNILFEAALSFLGVGLPDRVPSWGRMLSDAGGSLFTVAPWMMFFPGMALFLTTLAFNLVGDGLRDALDPRTSSRPTQPQPGGARMGWGVVLAIAGALILFISQSWLPFALIAVGVVLFGFGFQARRRWRRRADRASDRSEGGRDETGHLVKSGTEREGDV